MTIHITKDRWILIRIFNKPYMVSYGWFMILLINDAASEFGSGWLICPKKGIERWVYEGEGG
jgi:hypothetical protein